MIPTKALVVGLGASGLAAARLLLHEGAQVRGYDRRAAVEDLPDGLEVDLGSEAPQVASFADLDLLVLSPGVPPEAFIERARALAPQARVHGELSLALEVLAQHCRPKTVLVTGTNGKSTVTALIGALLRAGGHEPFVGGNLGTPLATMVLQRRIEGGLWPDHVVLECSSFQLETLPAVPTAVGIVLNVTPDHMDRYPTIDAYAQTKARVFAGVGSGDLALLDADDPWTDRIAPTGPRLTRIGHDGDARIEGSGTGERLVLGSSEAYPRDLLRLPGRHNAKNALFALAAARHLGVSASDCRNGLRGFEGLPHRMTLVRHLDGVNYYNDSKATNVASALASLGGLAEPFVLIAGGRGKGDDLTPLRALLAARGRGLVAVGETAEQFQTIGNGVVPTQRAADMNEAVTLARVMARSGDAVVLAPACASYDQFRSYAHRGEVFTAAVNALR